VKRKKLVPLASRPKRVKPNADPFPEENYCGCGDFFTPNQLADSWGWDLIDTEKGALYQRRSDGRRANFNTVYDLQWGKIITSPEDERYGYSYEEEGAP